MPAPSNSNEEPVPDYIANFNDIHGWYHAWTRTEHSWRGWGDESRPVRLYYPASLQYNAQDGYNAIDGMGRQIPGDQPYACTINPSSGKFERLCVQTRDSFCTLENSTWDRTIIRNIAPRLFRLANFPLQAVPPAKRHQIKEWTREDWISVVIRWIPASLGIVILVSFGHRQYICKLFRLTSVPLITVGSASSWAAKRKGLASISALFVQWLPIPTSGSKFLGKQERNSGRTCR
jgi:hypothetical protein